MSDALQYPRHAAAAMERRPQPFHKRQASTTDDPYASITGSVMTQGEAPTTYTEITPSPGMKPVPVTEQGQVVPSWTPLYTLCLLDPGPSPIANSNSGYSYPAIGKPGLQGRYWVPNNYTNNYTNVSNPNYAGPTASRWPSFPTPSYLNHTYPQPTGGSRLGTAPALPWTRTAPGPIPTGNSTNATTAPSVSLSDGCRTVYSSTQTTVCATTVTGLATRIPITDCDQLITFSTQYGYVQSVPQGISDVATLPSSAQPAVQTLTTYWEARWQELSGGNPEHITQKVCSTPVPYYQPGGMPNVDPYTGGERCVDIWQALRTSTSTYITSTTTTFDFTTTIPGPSELIIQHYHVTVTGEETDLKLSSSMVLQYSTEAVVTSTENLGSSATLSGIDRGTPEPGSAAVDAFPTAEPTANAVAA
ncbi:MAG: hypothetical protein M1831_002795 [Alyxoria varia]|nr:MAG: hypothetical protein M1831_002795 [Alyxoria varia]